MDTSLMSALIGAQTGMLQLAVAARLARADTNDVSGVTQLIDAADASANSLANVAAGLGANLDVST